MFRIRLLQSTVTIHRVHFWIRALRGTVFLMLLNFWPWSSAPATCTVYFTPEIFLCPFRLLPQTFCFSWYWATFAYFCQLVDSPPWVKGLKCWISKICLKYLYWNILYSTVYDETMMLSFVKECLWLEAFF